MGYDMYIVDGPTEAESIAKAAAQEQVDAAIKRRDALGASWDERRKHPDYGVIQAEVEKLYNARFELPSEYFRLNIWGMSRCCGYMEERGMIYGSSYRDGPQFQEVEYPDRDDFEDDAAYDAAHEEYERKYEELNDPVVRHHPEGGNTIPSHKFSDNSGWLVTEEECKAAVTSNALFDPPTYEDEDTKETKPVPWWPGWINFLERAATRGGFKVH
jgi:hypothetical protein